MLSITTTRDKKRNVSYPQHEIEKWIERERQDGNDEVIAYTDAGYENQNGKSNGAYLAVDSNGYIEERGINLTKLEITSSTRAEVATIVEVIQSFPNT